MTQAIYCIWLLSSNLASPEEFLLCEEAGDCNHQEGEDQASDHAPERGTHADCVKPCGYAAHCKDRAGEEVGHGVGQHRVLSAAAQTTSLDVPFKLQSQYECSCKGCHASGCEHIREVAVILGYASVDRVEDDSREHECESEISEPCHDVTSSECQGYECRTKDCGNHEVRHEMSGEKSPELHKHRCECNDSGCNMMAVNLNGNSGS